MRKYVLFQLCFWIIRVSNTFSHSFQQLSRTLPSSFVSHSIAKIDTQAILYHMMNVQAIRPMVNFISLTSIQLIDDQCPLGTSRLTCKVVIG